jgi:GntR family transcriptional regulator
MSVTAELRYLNFAETLRSEILALPPNTVLPTEQQLSERFGTSRVTLRRAMDLLEQAGLVSRQRGRGTIVSPPKLTRMLPPLTSIEEDCKAQNRRISTKVPRFEPKFSPPEFVQKRLQLRRGETVGFLELIRLIDDRVASCEHRFLPAAIAKRFDPAALATESFIEIVRGIQPGPSVTADWELDVVPVFREAAAALGITPGVLVVETVSAEYLKNGTPILVSRTLYRIDRVNFKAGGSWTISKRANPRVTESH